MAKNQFQQILWLIVCTSVALIPRASAQAGLAPGGFPANHGEPVKGAPYSAEAITEFASGGTTTLRTITRIYRDSEGRERREESLDTQTTQNPAAQRPPTISIFNPVDGSNYTLNVLQHTAVRMPLPGAQRSGASFAGGGGPGIQPTITFTPAPGPAGDGAQSPQVVIQQGNHLEVTGPSLSPGPPPLPKQPEGRRVETLEPKIIEGLRAEGVRIIEPVPVNSGGRQAGEIVTETWTSPELKITLLNQRTDPRGGDMSYRLTQISRSEPDAKLFQIPEGYTVQEMPSISGGMVTGGVTIQVQPQQ